VSLAPLFTWRTAISTSDLEPTTRHVALALSLYMNERGGSAFPGAARLAKDTGLSERTVRDHLGLLVRRGWLEILRDGGGRARANEYAARFPETGNTERGSGNLDAANPAADDAKPGSSFPPTLQEHSKTSPGKRRKRRPTRQYEWTVQQEQYANEHGLVLNTEVDAWLDWCEANGKTYENVTAGFSTWLRQAVRFGRGGTPVATLEQLAEPAPKPEPRTCPLDLCGGSGFVDIPGTKKAAPCRCRTMASA
jgi:hypothetical protein